MCVCVCVMFYLLAVGICKFRCLYCGVAPRFQQPPQFVFRNLIPFSHNAQLTTLSFEIAATVVKVVAMLIITFIMCVQ